MNQNFNEQRDPLPTFNNNEPDFGNNATDNRAPLPEFSNNQQQQYGYNRPMQAEDPQVNAEVDKTFGKALAAAIMSNLPIASIIAIFFGRKAWKMAWATEEIAKQRNARVGGKNIASKIMSIYGIVAGAVYTFLWTYLGIVYGIMIFSIIASSM